MSRPGPIDLGARPPAGGGTVLLAVGAVLLAAGLVALAFGVSLAVGQAGAIDDDAVAEGVVGDAPRAFESAEPGLTVYLDFTGLSNNSVVQDRASGATSCTVTADGFEDTFSGARQGVAATLGDYVSVGSFTLPRSSGRIACAFSRSEFGAVPFLVTPRGTGEVGMSVIVIIGAHGSLSGPSQVRTPTASRYSFSKRAWLAVPQSCSSQNASRAASNSAARSLAAALRRAAIVGP